MKTIYFSAAAMMFLVSQAFSQVVVQQQTVTTTFQPSVPGFQSQFNLFSPFANLQQNQMFWDPVSNSYMQMAPNQQVMYVDQFGNPVQMLQQQNQVIYVDQFGNPVQPLQQVVYVDQFGNPLVQPNQQFSQQVISYDMFGNPVYQQVPMDPFQVAPQTQIFPVVPQTQFFPANPQQFVNTPVNSFMAIDQGSFSNVLMQLNNQSFESTKLTLARQILNSNYFTSEQIRQMMTQMTFEDSRIEIARQAYSRVVDPQNYFTVNSAFTFSSSVDELNRSLFGR
jgi:hypothetical protein